MKGGKPSGFLCNSESKNISLYCIYLHIIEKTFFPLCDSVLFRLHLSMKKMVFLITMNFCTVFS